MERRQRDPIPIPELVEPGTVERKRVPVESSLESIIGKADSALESGDEALAMECLRQAKEAYPDDPAVRSRTLHLQRRIKAGNLVRAGRRKLAAGSHGEALAAAVEAFGLVPDIPGLDELVEGLEKAGAGAPPPSPAVRATGSDTQAAPTRKTHAGRARGSGADDFVRRVREQIQLSSFPRAAEIALEGLEMHPGHELLETFVEKFRKMGLLPG